MEVSSSKALQNLHTSLKRRMSSQRNIEGYLDAIKRYCDFYNISPDQLVEEAKEGKRNVVDDLQNFVDHLISAELAPKTIRRIFFQVQKLFRSNKVRVPQKSVELPFSRVIYTDRAITEDEIKTLLKSGDLRQRAIVLLLASSGIRLGSVPHLKVKHLEKVTGKPSKPIKLEIPPEAAKYHRAYTTFITPEAYNALQDYFEFRRKYGEQISDETPLIRNSFSTFKPDSAANHKVLKYYGLNTYMTRMAQKYLRTEKKKRHDFKMSHGFRKFFRTMLDASGVPTGAAEMLMGHAAGLVGTYTRHTKEQLRNLYSKAIQKLTIEKPTPVISKEDVRKEAIAILPDELLKPLAQKYGITVEGLRNIMAKGEPIKKDIGINTPMIVGEPIKKEIKSSHLKNIKTVGKKVEESEDCQQVINESELEEYLKEGWRFIASLNGEKVVIEK